jgi:hypothetical protein
MPPDQRGKIDGVVDRLAQILRRVAFTNEGVDVMRGAEGEAAQWHSDSLARSRSANCAYVTSRPVVLARFCSPMTAAAPCRQRGRSARKRNAITRFSMKPRHLAWFLTCRRSFWRDTCAAISTLIRPGSGSEI